MIKRTKRLKNKGTTLNDNLKNDSELKVKKPTVVDKTKERIDQNVEETLKDKEKQEQPQDGASLLGENDEENLVVKPSLPVERSEIKETSKSTYRSKRLQQIQEEKNKLQETLKSEKSESSKDEDDSIQGEQSEEELEEESSEESETSSDESEADDDVSEEDWKPYSKTTGSEKSKISKKPRKRRNEKIETNDEAYSSDDEESNKPLALIKKELEESPKKKIVTKVIKVVKKIRLPDGKVKKKLIKVIKRVKRVDEDLCPKIPGMRRTRCKKCSGCRVKDDCGKCVFCK